MSRRKATRNRLARIRAQHLKAVLLGPVQAHQSTDSKSGYVSGQATIPTKNRGDRPLGNTMAEASTRVYRHKLRTDPKAVY